MTPIAWPEAQRICDIPEVREALDKFAVDACEDHMLAMVSAIMGHAVTQGRAAGLEEAAKVLTKRIQESYQVHQRTDGETGERYFGDDYAEFMEVAYHAELGALAEVIKLKTTASPTPSDAGKDDALTIARDALDEIALAGMSGSGQESEDGMRDWHARRAWEFIGIAARAKTAIDAAIAAQGEGK